MRSASRLAWLAWLLAAGAATAQVTAQDTATGRDDRPPGAAPLTTTSTWAGVPVQWRLGYELDAERRRNFDLDFSRDRDRLVVEQEFKVEARFRPAQAMTALLEVSALSEVRRRPASGEVERLEGLQRGPMWLQFEGLAGDRIALQLGRVSLAEPRSFWWDDELDAARLRGAMGPWALDTGLGRELAREHTADDGIDTAHDGVTRWFGQVRWAWRPQHAMDLFWLRAIDRSGTPAPGKLAADGMQDEVDARLGWLGLRASGLWRGQGGHRLAYWAEAAAVQGRETLTDWTEQADGTQQAGESRTRRVRGRAWDGGLQWALPWPGHPTLLVAWAQGSGGTEGDDGFRQTGLQENKQRLAGGKRFKRYGELFDPELANLRVLSLGLGWRLRERTSVELVWHRYRQALASTRQRDNRIAAEPNGRSTALGEEFDLLLAMREWQHAELTLALARFTPGAAYDLRDAAYGLSLGLEIGF